MKRVSLLVVLMFALSIGRWVAFSGAKSTPPEVRVIAEQYGKTTLEFKLNGFELSDLMIGGKTFSKISLPGQVTYLRKGLPETAPDDWQHYHSGKISNGIPDRLDRRREDEYQSGSTFQG